MKQDWEEPEDGIKFTPHSHAAESLLLVGVACPPECRPVYAAHVATLPVQLSSDRICMNLSVWQYISTGSQVRRNELWNKIAWENPVYSRRSSSSKPHDSKFLIFVQGNSLEYRSDCISLGLECGVIKGGGSVYLFLPKFSFMPSFIHPLLLSWNPKGIQESLGSPPVCTY